MAVVDAGVSPEKRERTFFAGMALAVAATIAVGFGSWALRGNVIQPIPPLVHLHGAVFVFWVVLFVVQTQLVQRNSLRLHRRLGWLSLIVAITMVVVGTLTGLESVALKRVPPFFPESIFLALNFLDLVSFAGLFAAAIVLRHRTDWHRRMMLGTMFALMEPAWGRLLPMEALGPFGGLAITGIILVAYLSTAAVFDLYNRGKLHPAYYVVGLVLIAKGVGPGPLGMTPLFVKLAASLHGA